MDVIYQDDHVKIKKAKFKTAQFKKIKDRIINTGASKIIYIMDKIDNIPKIKILEKDFYPQIVNHEKHY